jgi:NADPH2:quinone reductase
MKAAVIRRFGPPEVLTVMEVPTPVPAEGEILVKVRAIGVNFADVFARLGVYPGIPKPPFVPGIEYAGTVDKTGKGAGRFKRGDRVFGFTRQNGYAEYVCVKHEFAVKMPPRMTFKEAATFTVPYLTSYHGIVNLAHGHQGEKILIHAGAGGVGIAAIQLAKHLGMEVFTTVGSEEKAKAVYKQGADHIINYRTEDFSEVVRRETNGYGLDVIMDGVAGPAYSKGLKLLAPMGRYILFGVSSANARRRLNILRIVIDFFTTPRILLPTQLKRNVGYHAFNLYFLADRVSFMAAALGKLLSLYRKGVLKPVIGATYRLDQVVQVHQFLQSRKAIGKIVLIP